MLEVVASVALEAHGLECEEGGRMILTDAEIDAARLKMWMEKPEPDEYTSDAVSEGEMMRWAYNKGREDERAAIVEWTMDIDEALAHGIDDGRHLHRRTHEY